MRAENGGGGKGCVAPLPGYMFLRHVFLVIQGKANTMRCKEKELFIPYLTGEQTRVYMNCTDVGPLFTVFLAGEEGNITLYSQTDATGTETWYEGDGIVSDRAAEIGKLLDIN